MTFTMSLPKFSSGALKSVRVRILAAFMVLLGLVQIGGFLLISTFGSAAIRSTVSESVVGGARVIERLVETDTQRLIEGARLLSADPAFRDLVAGGDREVLTPALAKHAKRIGAGVMLMIDPNQRVVAGSLDAEIGRRVGYTKLLDRAAAAQQATGVVQVGGQLYQLVIVPLRKEQQVSWVAAGYRINDALAQEWRNLTRLDVTFLGRPAEGDWRVYASTLAEADRGTLAKDVGANRLSRTDARGNAEYGDAAITRVLNLAPRSDEGVVAVLQAPLAPAFEPFLQMQQQLALISLAGVVGASVLGLLFARRIVGPLLDLTAASRRVAAGDYTPRTAHKRSDEIGDLNAAFAYMVDRVSARVTKITEIAHRDTLTGLPTRVLFVDRLEQALGAAARGGTPVALLYIDVDRFSHVNDTLGHALGDMLLREVAARLRSVVRRASDSVARIGADEFAIMMPGSKAADAQRVAAAVIHALEMKLTLDGHIVDVSASIGIAAAPEHGNDPARLMQRADVAMNAAKRDQLGIVVWDDQYDENGGQRVAMLADLRNAIDNEQLTLIYQPKVGLTDSTEHHVEALLRWQHPQRGLVPPSDFVPLAEQTGYIRTLTVWVLKRATGQCAEWRSRGLPMNVSVNISARDLLDIEFPDRLKRLLMEEDCAAKWLTLEIAESAIVGEPGHALKSLERLRDVGCRLSVDEYGSGYSSLAYLRRLPLNEIKVDKSFTLGMANDASDALIVRSTIELAHKLGLAVIATGVEDDATLEQLRVLGCDAVQGFLFARPLAPEDVPDWITQSDWTRGAREKGSLRLVV